MENPITEENEGAVHSARALLGPRATQGQWEWRKCVCALEARCAIAHGGNSAAHWSAAIFGDGGASEQIARQGVVGDKSAVKRWRDQLDQMKQATVALQADSRAPIGARVRLYRPEWEDDAAYTRRGGHRLGRVVQTWRTYATAEVAWDGGETTTVSITAIVVCDDAHRSCA